MTTTYTDNTVSIQKNLIFGWSVLAVDDDGKTQWMPFEQLDSATQRFVQEHLTNTIFPQEAREHMKVVRDAVVDSEFPLKVMNTLENWKLLEETGVSWMAENEGLNTMDAVFFSEEDRTRAKEALKASSNPYPDNQF